MSSEDKLVPAGDPEDGEITARLDAAAIAEAHEARRKSAPEIVPIVRVGARSDLGRVREINEDKFDFLEPDHPELLANNGSIYAVADGMGGHAAGQIASELALKTLLDQFYSVVSEDIETRLRAAIREANSMVYDTARAIPERAGMGTTLVAAVLREDDLFIAHVGDSRAYLIRDGQIARLTRDHSWIEEQIQLGGLSEEEARQSPFRNVITRSVGIGEQVEAEISRQKICAGDVILLCTDGLTGHLADEEIAELARDLSPSFAAWRLVREANARGGHDNITVLIVRIERMERFAQTEDRAEAKRVSPGLLSRLFRRH